MATARYYDAESNQAGAEYIPGVPLRDLTDEEWDALTKDQQASVDAAAYYRKTKPRVAAQDRAADTPATGEKET
jgi:hypothetical protein